MTRAPHGCLTSFPLWMLTTFRGLFAAMLGLGGYAAFGRSLTHGAAYVACMLAVLALLLLAMCRRCSYPRQHGTCLFFPYSLMRLMLRMVPAPPPGPMTGLDKAGTIAGLIALALVPIPWLWGTLPLLAIYAVLGTTATVLTARLLCPRCMYAECPLNRASKGGGRAASAADSE